MAMLDDMPVRTAKAHAKRWMVETALGDAFLPGDGRSIPLRADKAQAVRASIEHHIATEFARFQQRMQLGVAIMVVTIIFTQWFGRDLDGIWEDALGWVTRIVLGMHGLVGLYEAWRYERGIMVFRDAITHALAKEVPLSAVSVRDAALIEPNLRIIGGITFACLIPFAVHEPILSHPWISAVAVGGLAGVALWLGGSALLRAFATKDRARR